MDSIRKIAKKITGIKASDGNGVKLTRIIGSSELPLLDPFLMLDVFKSDDASDYIGGFPSHPHRGFETITYLLAGQLRHKDSEGHEGVIEPGGVQWMTAGKGIVHSEMPEQKDGLLQGFQLWLNLPADHKFTEPRYQELAKDQIVTDAINETSLIRVIAGTTENNVIGSVKAMFVQPRLFDVSLTAGTEFKQRVSDTDNSFIYVIEGELTLVNSTDIIAENQLATLENGNLIQVIANKDARFLFASAQPLNEPIARGGPFVMTTQQQLQQAFRDFPRS